MEDDIISGLAPLFERAECEGLWFYCWYQNLWFSPEQLREAQANGRFLWGAINWELRPPQEYVDQASKELAANHAELERRKAAIAK